MGRTAVLPVMSGVAGVIDPGETIPDTFTDHLGGVHPTDFDRLEALGCVAPVEPAPAAVVEPVVVVPVVPEPVATVVAPLVVPTPAKDAAKPKP